MPLPADLNRLNARELKTALVIAKRDRLAAHKSGDHVARAKASGEVDRILRAHRERGIKP